MSRMLLTCTANGIWLTADGASLYVQHWYPNGTTIWINPITKYIDSHPNGTDPSVTTPDGTNEWWVKGQLHRIDGPARETRDGHKDYFVEGKLHRIDGPAREWNNGDAEWYFNGLAHRIDGPAREYSNADCYKQWFMKGLLHRIDGPALKYRNGSKKWFVGGVEYTEEEYESEAVLDIRSRYANVLIKSAG